MAGARAVRAGGARRPRRLLRAGAALSRPPGLCADRTGFLFAHDCDRPAALACTRCGKPICVEHARESEAGPACITCLRLGDDDSSSRSRSDRGDSTGGGSSSDASPGDETAALAPGGGAFGGAGAGGAWSGAPPGGTGDDPYFYGSEADRAGYYDADDFRAFDTAAAADAAEGGGPETDTGAS